MRAKTRLTESLESTGGQEQGREARGGRSAEGRSSPPRAGLSDQTHTSEMIPFSSTRIWSFITLRNRVTHHDKGVSESRRPRQRLSACAVRSDRPRRTRQTHSPQAAVIQTKPHRVSPKAHKRLVRAYTLTRRSDETGSDVLVRLVHASDLGSPRPERFDSSDQPRPSEPSPRTKKALCGK